MKNSIPDLMSVSAFEPHDLAVMQSVFEQACTKHEAHHPEHRAVIAIAILDAYTRGERDRQKLLDAALAAAV